MSEGIWVSEVERQSTVRFQFGWPDSAGDNKEIVDLYRQLQIDTTNGLPLPADRFPSVLETTWGVKKQSGTGHNLRLPKELPNYVNWVCPVVSDKVADILLAHNLGASNLYPVAMHRLDRGIDYDQKFFILNIAVTKETVVPDESKGLKYSPKNPERFWTMRIGDGDLAARRDARAGPDIWIDPNLRKGSFFLSARLRAALAAAGLAEEFCLYSCRLV